MPRLRDVQRRFAASLRAPGGAPPGDIAGEPQDAAARLLIHRQTMNAALITVLTLSYPVVHSLVGKPFFNQAARGFIAVHPPRSTLLNGYGRAFPAFLADYAPALSLPYLPAVAAFEAQVEETAERPAFDEAPPAACARLQEVDVFLCPSLRLVQSLFPVDVIWRAVLDDDDEAMRTLHPVRAADPFDIAVWREGDGVQIARVSQPSARFLAALLTGADGEAALTAAAASAPSADLIAMLTREVLTRGFVRLVPTGP